MLPFIVSCLEALRAEDAAATDSPNTAAVGLPTSPASVQRRDGTAVDWASDSVGAVAPASHAKTAQQDMYSQPSEERIGAAVAPHKQAPFAGVERLHVREQSSSV